MKNIKIDGFGILETLRSAMDCYKISNMDIDYCYYKQIGMTRKMKARKRAFRYLFIPEVSTGMVQLQVFHEFLSLSKQAAFSSDSSLLNQIWSVSEETFKLCSDLFLSTVSNEIAGLGLEMRINHS